MDEGRVSEWRNSNKTVNETMNTWMNEWINKGVNKLYGYGWSTFLFWRVYNNRLKDI